MNEPLALFATEPKLSPRQAEALEHLRAAGPDGLTGQELGRLIYPAAEFPRSWGLRILKSLKSKGLVEQKRNGIWRAIGAADNTLASGQTDRIPY